MIPNNIIRNDPDEPLQEMHPVNASNATNSAGSNGEIISTLAIKMQEPAQLPHLTTVSVSISIHPSWGLQKMLTGRVAHQVDLGNPQLRQRPAPTRPVRLGRHDLETAESAGGRRQPTIPIAVEHRPQNPQIAGRGGRPISPDLVALTPPPPTTHHTSKFPAPLTHNPTPHPGIATGRRLAT